MDMNKLIGKSPYCILEEVSCKKKEKKLTSERTFVLFKHLSPESERMFLLWRQDNVKELPASNKRNGRVRVGSEVKLILERTMLGKYLKCRGESTAGQQEKYTYLNVKCEFMYIHVQTTKHLVIILCHLVITSGYASSARHNSRFTTVALHI